MAYPLARVAFAVAAALVLTASPAAALPAAGGVLFVDQPPGDLLDGANTSNLAFAGGRTMSEDGRYVVFASDADALETSGHTHVFRRDLTSDTTVLISTGANGPTSASCSSPTVSSDGGRVAFTCAATNLVDGVTTQA